MRQGARDWLTDVHSVNIVLADITEEDRQKLERYSAATAAIALIVDQAVYGQGAEARFGKAPPSPPERSKNLLLAFQQELEEVFYQASLDLPPKEALQVQRQLAYFEARSDDDSVVTEASFILFGGDGPGQTTSLISVALAAFGRDPDNARRSQDERIAITHELVPVLTGRASVDIETFMNIRPLIEDIGQAHLVRRGHSHSLDGIDRRQGGSGLLTLKCPAHQRIGHGDSALQRQIHAGINMAGDWGFFA